MTDDPYVDAVARLLTIPAETAQPALDDLRTSLAELSASVGRDGAVAALGPATAYAAALNDELGRRRPRRLLGVIPNSFGPGIRGRLADTFDPADPRIVIPRVLGGGWTLNSGAIAARLGLFNPDDLDDEIAHEAVDGTAGRLARAAAVVPALVTLVVAARSASVPASERLSASGMAAAGIGLAVASASEALEPRTRLAMPGVGAYLSSMAAAMALGASSARPRPARSVLSGVLVGGLLSFGLKALPLRLAVTARTRADARTAPDAT